MNRVPFTPLVVTIDDTYETPPAPKTPHRANAAKIQALIMTINELRTSQAMMVNKINQLEREIAINRRAFMRNKTE